MEEKSEGIVLGGTSYGENDKILTILTLEKGVVSAKIKGVKKAGAKMKFASEPFCFAEFLFAEKHNMRTVTGASLIDSFYPLREDLNKYFSAGAALEYAKKFLPEGISSPAFFMLLVSALKDMAYGAVNAAARLAGFLVSALKISGYGLNLSGCAACGKELSGRIFFDYGSGGFCCENCASGGEREINFSTYEQLKAAEEFGATDNDSALKPLRLLEFYLSVKPEVNLKSLKELLKLLN